MQHASPNTRTKMDTHARNTRRNAAVRSIMLKGQKLCLDQKDVEVLQVVKYRLKTKTKYVYGGQGEMLERFKQGKPIEPNVSEAFLRLHDIYKELVPAALPQVEAHTPSQSVISPGSGARLSAQQMERLKKITTSRADAIIRTGMEKESIVLN